MAQGLRKKKGGKKRHRYDDEDDDDDNFAETDNQFPIEDDSLVDRSRKQRFRRKEETDEMYTFYTRESDPSVRETILSDICGGDGMRLAQLMDSEQEWDERSTLKDTISASEHEHQDRRNKRERAGKLRRTNALNIMRGTINLDNVVELDDEALRNMREQMSIRDDDDDDSDMLVLLEGNDEDDEDDDEEVDDEKEKMECDLFLKELSSRMDTGEDSCTKSRTVEDE